MVFNSRMRSLIYAASFLLVLLNNPISGFFHHHRGVFFSSRVVNIFKETGKE